MWSKIKRYIEDYPMIQRKDRILVGLSGGADSVCLLRFLLELSKEKDFEVFAVHINHMIRKEGAMRDEEFSRNLCKMWNVPLKVYQKDVPAYAKKHHMTEEEAGRTIRYACFDEMAEEWKCNKIAVAHHKDDLAETVLFRMIRGTGIYGLGAIAPVTQNRIRPLLGVTRAEILHLLAKMGQEFVEDETNGDTEYSRNYIRHEILPRIENMNAEAVGHLAQLSSQALELREVLEPIFQAAEKNCIIKEENSVLLSVSNCQAEKSLVQTELIRRVLFQVAMRRKDISHIHIEQIQKLFSKDVGKRLSLPYQVEVLREPTHLRFYQAGEWERAVTKEENIFCAIPKLQAGIPYELTLFEGITLTFLVEERNLRDYTKGDCAKYFDYGKIIGNVCIRNRRDGDYFIVDRQEHKKMLRRYFIDKKIPKEDRGKQLLLADGSHVLWILGGRISETCKVTEDTKYVLKVTWSENTFYKMEEMQNGRKN